MVNTRRMESNGSVPESGLRHRTRSSGISERPQLSNDSVTDEESQDEDSKPLLPKSQLPLPSRVKELRSRFVCSDLPSFSSHHIRKSRESRNSRNRISLNDRHSLAIYTSRRNMDGYSEAESDDEVYIPRLSVSRHDTTKSTLARIERRTALSLRPLSYKSYADPHSPHLNSETEDDKYVVRRSLRNRKLAYESMSWLDDNQMPTAGYPNPKLVSTEYSEEDSRDAQDHQENSDQNKSSGRTRRSTRHSLRLEDITIHTSRRSRNEEVRVKDEVEEPMPDEEVKENGLLRRVNCSRLRKSKNDKDVGVEHNENCGTDAKILEENVESIQQGEDGKVVGNGGEGGKVGNFCEGDEVKKPRTRTAVNNRIPGSSSSSEVGGRTYSLRNRPPKPPLNNTARRVRELAEAITRSRRYNRRRKVSSSSESDSSSDSSEICNKKNKYSSKTTKTPYSKGDQRLKSGSGSKIIPIGPEKLDTNIRFSSIGGLDSHVQSLKEMILLPMMYPEVFRQYQIQPPKGVLFHGPPGTGKTLLARALANECSFGSRKVSFFMRKGADLLTKWIGESEKLLRLLFEQAAEMKPSIIFFDELDGLAPVRSSRQDQVHASIVSTLLALMDGLDDRGDVIVIGATNRIDAIDPALRRPGRFDRELYFPLPARKEREEILNVHVDRWSQKPSPQLLSYLAENAVGYCGSDLKALCSEAVIQGFRRSYPQVYTSEHRLQLDPVKVKVEKVDFLRAKSTLIPASQRIRFDTGRKLLPVLKPLLEEPLINALKILEQSFPHGLNPSLAKVKLSSGIKPAHLLLLGDGPEHGQTTHLAPALLYQMEHIHAYVLDLATLYRESGISPEEACTQVFTEARRNIPSVVYVPSIDQFWNLISETVRNIFIVHLSQIDPQIPLLLLATANCGFTDLPVQIKSIFSFYRNEVLKIHPANADRRREFFKPLLVDAGQRPSKAQRARHSTPPPLPRAPTPPPTPMTEEQAKKLYEQEERTLRELRIFLRDMCKKLATNRLFYMFTKPVDTEEVPDYTEIIKQPMDLETMMTKVDFHRYECAKDFLSDIELIVRNALEYNPARTSADKQIRHRACSLRDYAYTLIKNEMDSDFEETCQSIAKRRKDRKVSVSKYLPPYINTPDAPNMVVNTTTQAAATTTANKQQSDGNEKVVGDSGGNLLNASATSTSSKVSPCRKRKISSWQRGFLSSRKKRKRERPVLTETVAEDQNDGKVSTGDESKENVPEGCKLEDALPESNNCTAETELSVPTNEPLSINCDVTLPKPEPTLTPRKRRLSDLLSPSELLDDPLEFDDVDQAINETVIGSPQEVVPVDVSVEELEKVLDQAVKVTANQTLQVLLDLHGQLSGIVRQFVRTPNRNDLPKELQKELARFKNDFRNNHRLSGDS